MTEAEEKRLLELAAEESGTAYALAQLQYDEGEIALIDASPDKLVELDRFQAIEGKTWNHPVLIGDRLYIRNAQEAACYQLSLR